MASVSQALAQTNYEFSQALANKDNNGSNLDKDSFMLLLVTQFQYQDPLNPMDDTQFIAQMAQFSSLEQMMNLNESMDSLVEATNNQQMTNATSYIGKMVSVSGNNIGKVTDADGNASISAFRYAFGDNVVKGTLTVRDSQNNVVYTEDLAGKQSGTTFEFNWNGLTNAGAMVPDGVYVVSLAAYNASGEAVLSDQVVDATVTGVVNSNGTIYLGMDGGQLLALSEVRQVSTPKTVSTGSNGSADDSASSDDAGTSTETGVSGGSAEAGGSDVSGDTGSSADSETADTGAGKAA